jgi:uncharacterized protein (DUF362 family)
VRAVGRIFASADVVAADVVAAEKIFGIQAREVAHIRLALDSGLGISSAAQVRVVET